MKRALIVATTASMIDQFNRSNIKLLQSMGYEVHIVCNFQKGNTTSREAVEIFRQEMKEIGVVACDFPIYRSPFAYGRNLRCCYLLKKQIDRYRYKIIHCHTPVGGMIARIAAIGAEKWGGKVIYTAHGFHFYRGCPWRNDLLYKNAERIMARYTDRIITINQEDYEAAKKFHLKRKGEVYWIPGVGVEVKQIHNLKIDIKKKRRELGFDIEQPLILSVGELNRNKNHEAIIRAITGLKEKVNYCICGEGSLKKYLIDLVKQLKLTKTVKFLGYRDDIIEIMKASDLFVHPSYREGLSVALMQAMAAELPVICSKIRGNTDLIKDKQNGYLVEPQDVDGFRHKIEEIIENRNLRSLFGERNRQDALQFDCKQIQHLMEKVYES